MSVSTTENDTPQGAVIEIIERRDSQSDQPQVLVPNEIRINGEKVMVPSGHPITIHPTEPESGVPDDMVLVTVTVMARRIIVDADQAPAEDAGEAQE